MKRSDPEVVSLQMPARPLCVGSIHADKTVYVYRHPGKPKTGPRNRPVYIRKDCIDWLLAYAADEYLHQGVVDTAVAEDEAPEGNCPGIPGLRVEWCFSTKLWLATFVSGPNAGKKTSLGPQDLTLADWANMQSLGTPDAIGDFSSADQRQRKAVAKALCLRNAQSAVAVADQSAVAEAYLETPKKTRRLGDSAAELSCQDRT